MMTVKDITELRKSGELDRAYEEARALYESDPEDRYARIALAHCVKALMERAASEGDVESLADRLEEYGALHLEDIEEEEMNNRAVWAVRAFMIGMKENERYDPEAVDRLADAVKKIAFMAPHRYYSILLDSFLRAKDADGAPWPGLADFVKWWGIGNLTPEDYTRARLNNGMTVASLAERLFTAYSKSLIACLEEGRCADDAEDFVTILDTHLTEHPEFQNTLYQKIQLLKALGRTEEAAAVARDFVRGRQNDFWAWSTLGDLSDDEDLRLSCYCRALRCKANPAFLGKVRYKLAVMMYHCGCLPEAKREFMNILDLYGAKGWHIPANLTAITSQKWFAETQEAESNVLFYMAHLGPAEDFLFGDKPEVAILITGVNQQKNTCSFITEDRRRGFFMTKNMRERFAECQIYRVRFAAEPGEKSAARLATCQRVTDITPYDGIFFKRVTGRLNRRPGQAFAFVDDIFIDGKLLAPGMDGGVDVSLTAVLYYHMKKEVFGWRAVSVQFAN